VSLLPIRRPTISGPEPGELSAMMRIGLLGYACATASGTAAAASITNTTATESTEHTEIVLGEDSLFNMGLILCDLCVLCGRFGLSAL
jgi:hypothetical protein